MLGHSIKRFTPFEIRAFSTDPALAQELIMVLKVIRSLQAVVSFWHAETTEMDRLLFLQHLRKCELHTAECPCRTKAHWSHLPGRNSQNCAVRCWDRCGKVFLKRPGINPVCVILTGPHRLVGSQLFARRTGNEAGCNIVMLGDWIVDSEMHENATNLRCFKPHPNNLQNQNRQGTHTTTQLVRDVHSAHKHASNLRGARFAKQILQNFKRHLPWSPSCCTFYHLASLQPGNDRRGSFTLRNAAGDYLRNLSMIGSTFKSHLTLVPWHTSTMSISLSHTQLQAIVYCHLCLSVVLTPQAFAPASGLLGLCHQL